MRNSYDIMAAVVSLLLLCNIYGCTSEKSKLVVDKKVFLVVGCFDLDNNGSCTDDDRQRVKMIILENGGDVTQRLSDEVDIVVRGEIVRAETHNGVDQAHETLTLLEYHHLKDMVKDAVTADIRIMSVEELLAAIRYDESEENRVEGAP